MSLSSAWSTEQFDKEYATLHPEQKPAVDTLEGPVLLLGGTGPDKTRLLAARIANMLQKTVARPGNILCLISTEAGIAALRKRLEQLTGNDAFEVNIYTFRGLCEAIIKDHPLLFETGTILPLSDLERIQLLTQLIDAFPKGHPLKRYRGDVYFEVNNLLSLFSIMLQEGWTPDYISRQIDEYLQQKKIADETAQMEKLQAAAYAFHHYEELLRSHHRYEQEEVTGWVIKAFEENPSLLQDYREQFTYLLIDDYQHLNHTQQRLAVLLTGDGDKPNVCVAANDQDIQPLPEALTRFTTQYKNSLVTILLNQPSPAPLHQPHVREYETSWQEMIGITLQVKQLLQQGVLPADIGIICKEHTYRQKLLLYLQLDGIPVCDNHPVNIFEVPLVQKILLLLNYLAAEQDIPYCGDEMLFELLHTDWFNIPATEIARLTIRLSDRPTGDNKPSLRRLLYEQVHTPPLDLFTQPVHEGLKLASHAVELLTGIASQATLPSLFENMIREAGITRFINQSPDRLWLQQVITSLLDFIQTETQRNPSLDLQQLSKLLTLMQRQHIPLFLLQANGSDKGIYLLTAEEFKEPEFNYVFWAGCNATHEETKNNNTTGYRFPESLLPVSSPTGVPMTIGRERAVSHKGQHLVFSYSRTGQDFKETAPAAFLAALIQEQAIPVERCVLQPAIMSLFRSLFQGEVMAPEISKPDEALVNRLLEKFMLSATALNNYLYCPLEFYYHNLIRVPSRRNEATEFGSAVHHALELLFRKMQAAGEAFPAKAVFISDFEQYMHRQRGSFSLEQFSRRMEYGYEVLSNYYDEYVHSWNTIVAVERNFRNVIVSGVPLKGKIDKLEFDGRLVNIVDYKTGDPERAKAQMTAPGEAMTLGGNYWRQAVFYKILVDNYRQKEWKVVSSELGLVEPDKQQQYHKEKLFITADDVAIVTQQIVHSWWRIQNRDFYTGCGKPDCYWCHFVKFHKLAVAWHPLTGS
jgi:DNA helicase-2/ATP-dependent DNA helicase PcrA